MNGDTSFLSSIILAVLGSGLVATILSYLFSRKKLKAETTKLIVEATAHQLESMRIDVSSLREQVAELKVQVETSTYMYNTAIGYLDYQIYPWVSHLSEEQQATFPAEPEGLR